MEYFLSVIIYLKGVFLHFKDVISNLHSTGVSCTLHWCNNTCESNNVKVYFYGCIFAKIEIIVEQEANLDICLLSVQFVINQSTIDFKSGQSVLAIHDSPPYC